MHARLSETDGGNRLVVDEGDRDGGTVVASSAVDVAPDDVFAFLAEERVGGVALPTVEEVTDAVDPWLAWYGGTDGSAHAVVYGRKGERDRKVSLRAVGGDGGGEGAGDDAYEVRLRFGTAADATDRTFEPADGAPVAVRTRSTLYAKRLFFDLCDVE